MFPVIVYLSLFLVVQGEFYSSLGHMEDLVYEEMRLITTMKDYIQSEQEKLDKMRNLVDNLKTNSEEAGNNIEKYLGHPVNQYLLVKRLKSEWDEMEGLVMRNSSAVEFLERLSETRAQLPNDEDIEGTAKAIMRLQDTYQLDTHDLAEGYVKGSRAAGSLSADDCFNIGRTAYLDQDFYHCALWMREAKNKIEHGDQTHDRFDILDHLSFCYGQQGNFAAAHELVVEMLMIDPTHERTIGNKAYYDQLLGAKKKGDDGEMATPETKLHRQMDYLPERLLYERLCRDGGNKIPERVEKKLKCYLWDNNRNPRLVFQPVKMEELWSSPHLVRFYDVLSDSEVNQLKELAKPRLNRATVQNPVTGKLEHAHYRVSKSAWLKDAENATIAKISLRMSDITGLSMATAEELQIANYGVGGQYEPHYDFARKRETRSFDEEIGNRIATFLFYLTDVEHGGSTIFLEPKIAVRPVKGSAVFWYNLYPSGAGDLRTRHAACPVLTGVKWVANKWIHERDQEFNRPCRKTKQSSSRIF